MITRWLALLLAVLAAGAAAPDRDVRVAVPAFSSEPAAVRLRVTVEPHEDQRRVRLVADSGQHYRASEWPLEGENGPRTAWIEWRDLAAGEYAVQAWVQTTTGDLHASRSETMVVLGRSHD